MQRVLQRLFGHNGYPLSALIALLLHGMALATILYWSGESASAELELVQPTLVKALLIDENPQLQERQRLERQREAEQLRQQQLADQRRREQERQREQEQQREQERQRQEDERRRLDAEQLRQQQLEQQRQQELLEEAERQRLDEQQRRDAEIERQRRLREQQQAELRRQQEEAAAVAARTEFELVQSGVALIQQFIEDAWSRPPSARNGMRAVLRINMLPTGEVTAVTVVESSGDGAFDRSAEIAVHRAQPFSELAEMPIHVFNGNFRTLSLIFQPEDLLN